ncbi:RdRp [Hubei permutotetra-like virus 5]|uniref:RdRp n=1 Tax=Hubei permutotetra-like virus 5 TaxID=1923079 RepID=UPI00090C8C7B|nr:RdRp [Hubei permutotetra-like virus 5]APG76967.1 RdRp [Hubei permutotetra-like virus 5]
MDTSNPIDNADRVTIGAALKSAELVRRQDLQFLQELTATARRTILKVETKPLDNGEVKLIRSQYLAQLPKVDTTDEPEFPDVLIEKYDQLPVCGIIFERKPIHPPGRNQLAGSVSTRRVFGGAATAAPLGFQQIAEIAGSNVLQVPSVYTAGTKSGFYNRINKQMGRKTVSIQKAYSRVLGRNVSQRELVRDLMEIMPRKRTPETFPDLEEDLDIQLSSLKITRNASAGAPYWRNKGECITEIIHGVLPHIVAAIKDGKLEELFREQPELFLVELKNKMDRYKVGELNTKTRPYVAVPAHWAFLFSVLSQRFQETLEVFDGNSKSANAYGFSSAGGGLTRMYKWMRNTKKGEPRFACYGDDTCLVVNHKGTIWRVDPDFQQMDGSIDYDDVKLTIAWIMNTFKQENPYKDLKFWEVVCNMWLDMAVDPLMILQGPTIYVKRYKSGLLTGIPGTTLFDTVKSVLMYRLYTLEYASDPQRMLDASNATNFFQKYGLVIKPGTWSPAAIPMTPEEDCLITDHKFLGVQMKFATYRDKFIVVPTIPTEEAINLMVIQKDDPFNFKNSATSNSRLLFDRMRGNYITFGFSDPIIQDIIHNVVNSIDPVAIVMRTQVETGQKPEHLIMSDYSYPDSSGFPSRDFCLSLYAGEEERAHWIAIYPELVEIITDLHKTGRNSKLRIVKQDPNMRIEEQLEPEESLPHKEFAVVAVLPNVTGTIPKKVDPNKRSRIVDEHGQPGKYLPDLAQTIVYELKKRGIVSIKDLCFHLNLDREQIRRNNRGFYTTGFSDEDLASLHPIETAIATSQEAVLEQCTQQAQIIKTSNFGENRLRQLQEGKQELSAVVETAPSKVYIDTMYFTSIPGEPKPGKDQNECIRNMILWMSAKCRVTSRWRTHMSPMNDLFVFLEVMHQGRARVVASCRCLNQKLGKAYITRIVYVLKDVPVPSDNFTASSADGTSWAAQVEAEKRPLPEIVDYVWKRTEDYKKQIKTGLERMDLVIRNPSVATTIGKGAAKAALGTVESYPDVDFFKDFYKSMPTSNRVPKKAPPHHF